MRIEIGDTQITSRMVDVLAELQNNEDLRKLYIDTLDEVTRMVILDIDGIDDGHDSRVLSRIRYLQMLRRDLLVLALPPDADLPENDKPLISV